MSKDSKRRAKARSRAAKKSDFQKQEERAAKGPVQKPQTGTQFAVSK